MEHLSEILNLKNQKQRKNIEILENSLTAFSNITSVPVTFFSEEGEILWEVNRSCKYCIANSEYFDSESACKWNLKAAMKTANSLGDVYIFVCNTDMINMCYAFNYGEELIGYFNAGPIAMGKSRKRTMNSFFEKVPKEGTDLPLMLSIAAEMKIWSTQEITYLSKLYLNALNSPFAGQEERIVKQKVNAEQSMIGMKIIEMKKSRLTVKYPLEIEQSFAAELRQGDAALSKKQFSEYMGELMVFDGGNISVIKLRLLTLFGKILNRELMPESDHRNLAQLEAINTAATFAEIMVSGNSLIDLITEQMGSRNYSGKSKIVRAAVDYIWKYFNEEITMKKTAEEIHVNYSYLSKLFKEEMNCSFVDYLSEIRLDTAADLLRESNDSVTEISYACGFKECSYFTKLFRNRFGLSPREYRVKNK